MLSGRRKRPEDTRAVAGASAAVGFILKSKALDLGGQSADGVFQPFCSPARGSPG